MNIDIESMTEAIVGVIAYMMEFEREEYFAKADPCLFQALVDTDSDEKRHLKILVDHCRYNSLTETGGYEVSKELKISVSLAVATEADIQAVNVLAH